METKPYNLQSPEQIAKDYGGNKQKIAEGMQMGIIDPTAGTLAGMFIDRMRSAAQQEQAPQQSVAQQVFTPPAPPAPPMGGPPMGGPPAPAGLGATPEAAQMPPMPGMGGPPPGAPPMGMAEGGMVPPYMAGGGLSDLPVPDDMFDEPRDGGYANGGIVAFAGSGLVGIDGVEKPEEMPEIGTTASRYLKPKSLGYAPAFDVPESIGGYSENALENLQSWKDLYTPETKRQKQVAEAYETELSPEGIKKAKQEDMWMALGQIGAKMATTPGSLLQAASAGMGEALPGIREAAKERKASQRAALKGLQEQENLTNKEAREGAQVAMEMKSKYATLGDALQDRGFKNIWEQMGDNTRRYAAELAFGSSIFGSKQQKEGQLGAAGIAERRMIGAVTGEAVKRVDAILGSDTVYNQLRAKNDLAGAAAHRQRLVQDEVKRTFSGDYGASADDPLGMR
jgi:hypothetical protein